MNTPAIANACLSALPSDIRDRWLEQGSALRLSKGAVLDNRLSSGEFFYFPLTAVLTWVGWLCDGASSAMAVIGHQDMVCLGDMPGLGQHLLTLHEGDVVQVPSGVIRADEERFPEVQRLCKKHLHALMAQAHQTALCNQHHSLPQRLIRLLQSVAERMDTQTLRITHQQLANLLGTRRERISQAITALQGRGIIRCARGAITIIDRATLLAQACECCALLRLQSGSSSNLTAKSVFQT